MKAQRGWRKGFEAKRAQERGKFSTSHCSPSAFVCRVPVHGQGFIGEHSPGQSSGAGTRSSGAQDLVLITSFQGERNPSKENKYLSSFLIFNSASSSGSGGFFHFIYLQLKKNTGREQSLNSLADVLLLLSAADVFSSAGVGDQVVVPSG